MTGPTLVDTAIVFAILGYITWAVMLNTSIGLRLGYNPYRVLPLSPIWPVLVFSSRLESWAKSGQCTLAKDHPLRYDKEVDE
jgi:hypothetical protein